MNTKTLPLLFIILAASCSSSPEASVPPSWITQTPQDSTKEYYIGIAGSHTGKESEDIRFAYNRALEVLSGSISTSIRASSSFSERETTQEGYDYSYENSITVDVSQNLENIEIVDSYYSPDLGYWYYLRLSHAEWDSIVERRSAEYTEFVEELFDDVFDTSYSEMQTIYYAIDAFYEAYSGKPIKVDILGKSGSADTILTLRAEELLSEMSLLWNDLPSEFEQRSSIRLEGRIELNNPRGVTNYTNPGNLPLVLSDQNDRVIKVFRTAPDGTFSLNLSEAEALGEMEYTLKLLSPFGNTSLSEKLSYLFPEQRKQVRILPYRLSLQFESSSTIEGQEDMVVDFLNDFTPLSLSHGESNSPEDSLGVKLQFRSAPPNSYGMVFSYATLSLFHISGGKESQLWRSEEVKEGGLSEDQAEIKALEKLLKSLEGRNEISQIFTDLP